MDDEAERLRQVEIEALKARLAELEARPTGVESGASAQGENTKAVGQQGVLVEGDVGGDFIQGSKRSLTAGEMHDISDSKVNMAGGDILQGGTVVVARDGARVYIGDQPIEISAVDRESGIGRYLSYMIAHNRYLQLQGIRSGGRLVNIELDQIYITLHTTRRRDLPEDEYRLEEEHWLAEAASLAPGEAQRLHSTRAQTQSEVVQVEQALAERRHLVVLGDPGSGKTTLLRYLALLYARDLAADSRAVQEKLGLPESGYLPVLLPLRRFGFFLRSRPDDGTQGHALLLEFLRETLKNERIHLPANFFDPYLDKGKALILLDGMDEIADPVLRGRAARLLEAFTEAYPACRFVVTSRVVGYKDSARLGGDYAINTVRDFSLQDVEHFLCSWHRLVAIGQLGPGQSAEEHAALQTEHLMQAIRNSERIRELAINPLMLTVIALVHRDRVRLPDRRAELYAEAVDVLLGKWDEARQVQEIPILEGRIFDAGDKRLLLQNLALSMQEAEQKEIAAGELRALLTDAFAHILTDENDVRRAVERFLQVIEERAGLLAARGEGIYAFTHLTFQEYLAALAIAARDDYVEYTLERSGDAWWREVVLLEAGHLSTQSRERCTHLIEALADHPEETEPYYNLVLAAECLRDAGSNRVAGNLEERLRRRLQSELETPPPTGLVQTLKNRLSRGMHARQIAERRCAAANALARIGGIQYWRMPYGEPECVEIPAGEFWMGSESPIAQDDEKPVHKVHVERFWIARTPVTNAQYALFVQDSKREAPPSWQDNHPPKGRENHPVITVTWHDAVAYCAWLEQKLVAQAEEKSAAGKPNRPRGALLQGLAAGRLKITLPSEAEWEKAARGDQDMREYPWGETFVMTSCNTQELGLDSTTPAGLFLQGASPYGVLDMVGNVWEWTRSLWGQDWQKPDYRYPYQAGDEREKLGAGDNVLRVLRGGSYYSNQVVARCARRPGLDPHLRSDDFGFRCVCSPL